MLRGLKKRIDEAKRAWANELSNVLWSYRTTPQSTTGKTPFKFTYGVDAMISVEIKEPRPGVIFQSTSSQALQKKANLANESSEMAYIQEKVLKHQIANRYSIDVSQKLQEGDLVL